MSRMNIRNGQPLEFSDLLRTLEELDLPLQHEFYAKILYDDTLLDTKKL